MIIQKDTAQNRNTSMRKASKRNTSINEKNYHQKNVDIKKKN